MRSTKYYVSLKRTNSLQYAKKMDEHQKPDQIISVSTVKKKPTSKKEKKKNVSKVPVKPSSKLHGSLNKTQAKPNDTNGTSPFPRHSIEKALRIPKAILDQNAGRECSEDEAAKFVGLTGSNGPFRMEISSSIKYGLLERPKSKHIKPTELAKQIIRPQAADDEVRGLQEGVLKAPILSDVYKHYRGENIPDRQFFENTLSDTFKIPKNNITEFISVFNDSLETAKLIEKAGDKSRIVDISADKSISGFDSATELKKLSKAAAVSSTDSCFVVMPFAPPLGDYYSKIYEPAIRKAGLNPVRADDDIFGTGKIIDQIWTGILASKVLIAELTTRNPNVFYELGLAHALKKPVVLVSSNEQDVPFDLKHIRVIYYDKDDPFWGNKLIDKVAENILSAIANPDEAVLFRH